MLEIWGESTSQGPRRGKIRERKEFEERQKFLEDPGESNRIIRV